MTVMLKIMTMLKTDGNGTNDRNVRKNGNAKS